MKYAYSLLFLLFSIFCFAQVPLVEIEGNTSIFLADDTTSVHIGKNAGLNRDPDTPLENTIIGTNAGRKLSYGVSNSFLGFNAGASNSSGSTNSFFGSYAGYKNTGGFRNSVFGFQAGYTNSLGTENSFFGSGAGYQNTMGSENNFFGRSAGSGNTTGFENNFFGTSAGYTNSIGKYNSFFGDEAGYFNTSGEFNVFIGYESGYLNQIGDKNAFLGSYAGSGSTGNNNVAIGYQSGVSGNNNVTIGYRAGGGITQGDDNIIIGYEAGPEDHSSINNRLFIDVNRSFDALIYGEFDNDLVKVNGNFHSTGKVLLENSQNVVFKNADGISEKNVLSLDSSNHTILNAVNDIIFNSGGTLAAFARAMTIKADNKVGIGTTDPQWKVVVKHTEDALVGAGSVIDVSNLSTVFAKESNDDNEGIGIGFQSSTDGENVGAAIVHERTGASSKGKLHFATKTTTGTGDDLFTRLTISDDGNIGFGITSPSETLHVNGDALISGLSLSGTVDVQADNNGKLVKVISDGRLKKDVEILKNALGKILAMRGVSYNWTYRENYNKTLGVIAQEIMQVAPELVHFDGTYYGVNYSEFPALFIEAIKDQQCIIDDLKSQLEKQQSQLESRDQQFASLLSRIEQLENDKTSDEE